MICLFLCIAFLAGSPLINGRDTGQGTPPEVAASQGITQRVKPSPSAQNSTSPVQQMTSGGIAPWIQPVIGIAQIAVTAILAFVLWRLTFILFVRNSQQKINERQAAWFHKVVVDSQLLNLNAFLETATNLVVEGAASCENAIRNEDLAELERRVMLIIEKFNELLLPGQRNLSDMVNCFDDELAAQCTDRFAQLQDQVTEWFEGFLGPAGADTTVSLTGVLSAFRSDIISQLRRYEFEEYGFQRPGLLRSLIGW